MVKPGWSAVEKQAADAAITGDVLNLAAADDRRVRAVVIRDLLLRRLPADLDDAEFDPRGVSLRGAVIVGRLDLDYVRSDIGLTLLSCAIGDGITLRFSSLSHLNLSGSTLHSGTTDVLIDANHCSIAHNLGLAQTTIRTRHADSAVRLRGAHIGGHLDLAGAVLSNGSGPALLADGLQVDNNLLLTVKEATGAGNRGAVRLVGTRIGGQLDLAGAVLSNGSGPALLADGLRVNRDARLEVKEATGSGELGAVRLLGAQIGGQLSLTGAVLSNGSGPALAADRLRVEGIARLAGMKAKGAGELGAVRLLGAHIGGQLSLAEALLSNSSGPALAADGLRVDSDARLEEVNATSTGEEGAVRLGGAQIGGQLVLVGAVLRNGSGPALFADGLRVDSDARLAVKEATGAGELGAVRLVGAQIGGQLNLAGAILSNGSGPALIADGVRVDNDARLAGMEATGTGELGAVRLTGARIGGRLGGDFAGVRSSDGAGRLELDGLTYQGVPSVKVDCWLRLLRDATTGYAAQPYRQLAAAAAAEGHDSQVRRVLMAQRRDQLTRATPRVRDRAWGHFTRVTLGYGYQPWLALLWLIGVVLVSVIVTVGWGAPGLYPKDHPQDQCTATERAVIGVDNALPLVTTNAAASCLTRPLTNRSAQLVTWTGVGAQISGWAFATLFIAGFTGAVRKT